MAVQTRWGARPNVCMHGGRSSLHPPGARGIALSCTDKLCALCVQEPAARLATLEAAGQEEVPFTTGILIGAWPLVQWEPPTAGLGRRGARRRWPLPAACLAGIGESRLDRIESLLHIRRLHQRYGHIQVGACRRTRSLPSLSTQRPCAPEWLGLPPAPLHTPSPCRS